MARAAECWFGITFRPMASTSFRSRTYGLGRFIPGEQLEILIDGERVQLFDIQGVGSSQGMSGAGDGALTYERSGESRNAYSGRHVPGDELSAQPRVVKQYERKTLENNSITQLQYYPGIGFLRIQGPFNAQRPEDSPQHAQDLYMPAGRTPVRRERPAPSKSFRRWRGAPTGVPQRREDLEALMAFYEEGREAARLRTASSWRCGEFWPARNLSCASK